MKLNNILKELATVKDLLLQKYGEVEELREMNENLRQLNARLSKQVKDLKEHSAKVEKNNKMLKEHVQGKSEDKG